jgi:hypothetical protein
MVQGERSAPITSLVPGSNAGQTCSSYFWHCCLLNPTTDMLEQIWDKFEEILIVQMTSMNIFTSNIFPTTL